MKYTLKPYQTEAVASALNNLDRARTIYHRDGEVSSFSLTATTGAGKTVMAAAAIEALFFGNADLDFDADPGAVVIWFSDDPNLNAQTYNRLYAASDKLTTNHLVTIEPPFSKPRLDPGKVYFLNTQKLNKNSLLTRGFVDESTSDAPAMVATPDLQGWTIWQTIANTIADDNLTLYLVLDEAHRGFNAKASSDKPTIVRRLVNGQGAQYPPVPVVWGISATIERFRDAMKEADAVKGRKALTDVTVDASLVQESGLVKDTVILDIPNESGNFDTVLVRRAARKLKDSTERWANYAKAQDDLNPVKPLLVLQTPNTPNGDDIGAALDTIFDEYPELTGSIVRHVFGDHSTQKFGAWEVEWIEPQRVEDTTQVRILVAKDAISTGWDCPRSEVMVSFRPAKDSTHITQLLGRMVRSPLARRVQGDERLNAVDCILPFFDRTTAGNVVKFLTGQIDTMPGADKKVLYDPRELKQNKQISAAVWDAWDSLPTQTLPQRGARPITRLVSLAHALSKDAVRENAISEIEDELQRVLDGWAVRFRPQLEKAIEDVWTVEVQQIKGKLGQSKLTYQQFVERADERSIRAGFETAKRAFGADIAMSYANHLAGEDEDGDELREAYVRTTALASILEVRANVDIDATELTRKWFAEHRVAIKSLTDERQQDYEDIRGMAVDPQLGELGRPRTRLEDYAGVDEHGQQFVAEMVPWHLMSDENGEFPLTTLNEWERKVVHAELARPDVRGWYRNPARAAKDSLGIAYRDPSGNWRSMHPDFVFFQEVRGVVRASIVDPHGHHLDDASLKLKALARFAAKHGIAFHRIEAISEVSGKLRVIDMQDTATRAAVLSNVDAAVELYKSPIAVLYDATPHG